MEFNEVISECVFSLEHSGRPVQLDLDDECVDALSVLLGTEPPQFLKDLVESVTTISNEKTPKGVFKEFADATKRWNNLRGNFPQLGHGLNTPPALALLAVLAFAAGQMRNSGDNDEKGAIGAGNYYTRLCEVIGRSEWNEGDTQREYRRYAVPLWQSLHDWLNEWQDERGVCTVSLPGASKENQWAIQMPISQALLRAADRDNLFEMFQSRGLNPGVTVSNEVMSFVLEEWCHRYGTKHLREVWKKQDYRSALVTSAQNALATWTGVESELGGTGPQKVGSKVGLIIEINSFTGQLDLGIEIIIPTNVVPQTVDIELDSGDQFTTQVWAGGPRTVRVTDTSAFDAESLISGVLKITSEEIGLKGVRFPRPIAVFQASTFGRSYQEVNQIFLGSRYGLMVRGDGASGDILRKVEDMLKEVARPGWVSLTSENFSGIPVGWTFIENVELVTFPESAEKDKDLRVLVPIEIQSLVITDGFRIPGRRERWLTECVPNISAIFPYESTTTLTVTNSLGDTVYAHQSPSRIIIGELSNERLLPGVYQISAESSLGEVMSASLCLVSSDTPNPATLDSSRNLRHVMTMGKGFGALSASNVEDPEPVTRYVQGVHLGEFNSGDRPDVFSDEVMVPFSRQWVERSNDARYAEKGLVKIQPAPPKSCVFENHHWMLDTFYGGRTTEYTNGYCKYCLFTRLHRARPKLRAELRSTTKTDFSKMKSVKPIPREIVSQIPPVPSQTPGIWDHAFASMCYLRRGTLSDLVQVASQVSSGSIGIDRLVRALSALGHIDVNLDDRCRPLAWSISPAVLVVRSENRAHLSGFRSPNLIAKIHENVESLGGAITTLQLENAPQVVEVSIPTGSMFSDVVSGVIDPITGSEIHVQENAAEILLSILPTISQILDDSPQVRFPASRQLNKWNGEAARWSKVEFGMDAGAYQHIGNGYVYTYHSSRIDPGEDTTSGTASSVKHMESLRAGVPLVFFDESSGVLSTPLGAELPGLLSRAAVALSGRTPFEDEVNLLVKYHDIDLLTANKIFQLLRK
jgi:hypothetical protein